jgi:hypothetical protein
VPARAADAPCAESSALDKTKPNFDAMVQQICSNGASVESGPGIAVTLPDGRRDTKTVTKGSGFSTGTTFSTPAGTLVDFITRTGNQFRAFNGASWTIGSTEKGDFINVAAGKLRFFVQHALGAFGVYAAPVFGLVPGTTFDVDLQPGAAVTYSVSEGRVRLTRNVTIRLTEEHRDIDGIRQTDYITAGGRDTITYKLPLGIFMTFANAAEAQRFFSQQLQQSTEASDQAGIQDSLLNIQRVQTLPPPGAFVKPGEGVQAASAPAGTSAAIIIPAVVVVGGLVGVIAGSGSPHQSFPQGNSGSVSVSSKPRHLHAASTLPKLQFNVGFRL